jgi:hypothetical protein
MGLELGIGILYFPFQHIAHRHADVSRITTTAAPFWDETIWLWES